MPLKYKLYSLVCYLTILVTAIIFIDIVYELSSPRISFQNPMMSLALLTLFFGSYFALPIFGLNLLRSVNSHSGIRNFTVIILRIIVFIQAIFQIIIVYNSPEIFRRIVYLFKNHFRFYSYSTVDMVIQLLGIPLVIFGLYLEIFTFLLVKEVKREQHTIIDELGFLNDHNAS